MVQFNGIKPNPQQLAKMKEAQHKPPSPQAQPHKPTEGPKFGAAHHILPPALGKKLHIDKA